MRGVTVEKCEEMARDGRYAIVNDGRVIGFTLKMPRRRQPGRGLEKTSVKV